MASLGRNIVANYVGKTWTALLGILLIPIYIKFLGIEAYGLVGFFMTLSSVLGILDLGIGSTMNRELARRSVGDGSAGSQRDLVRTLELIYWGIALLAGAIVIVFAPFIANTWIKSQELNPVLILKAVQLMGVSVALQFPLSLYQGGLMGMQKQVLVNAILVFTGTLRGGGAILVLWLVSPTIQAFFAWQVVMSIIGSLAFLVAIWSNLPKSGERAKFRKHIIYDVWKYAAAISANAIIGIILTQLDKVILSKVLSLKMFAYYSIASTVASALWMVIVPFNTAVFPHLVQLHELKQNEDLSYLFHRSSQMLSLILMPICAILIVFSKEILFLWLHDISVADNGHLIVSLLVFGTMLNGIASLPANSATAFGWPLLTTYTNIIQAVLIIPLIICMVNWLQGAGAAIAWIILNSIYVLFMTPLFFRRYLSKEQKSWYLNDILVPAAASFSICIFSIMIVPAMKSQFTLLSWIIVTGIIALIFTGLSLPNIRTLVQQKWSN